MCEIDKQNPAESTVTRTLCSTVEAEEEQLYWALPGGNGVGGWGHTSVSE